MIYSYEKFDISQVKRAEPPADNGMADCFDSVTLDNPLRYYKNYSYNACMNERKALCHAELCGCRDVTDPGKCSCFKSCRELMRDFSLI